MVSALRSSIHLPQMEVNPPKTACSSPCDGVIFIYSFFREGGGGVVGVSISPHGMHLSMYSCIYQLYIMLSEGLTRGIEAV